MNQKNLINEVVKARKVFDLYANQISETLFCDFPRGCCGNVSLLLGNWLHEKNFGDIKIILAKNDSGVSHSWIVVENVIVDITADQFENQESGIYPIDSDYHSTYEIDAEDDL